jgi:serine/threonine protein kinase
MINDNDQDDERNKTLIKILKKFVDDFKLGKIEKEKIGSGSFGLVSEIKYKDDSNKNYAAKVLERNNNNYEKEPNESDLILEFRGPNIAKVIKIFHKNYNKKNYDLILMEKAPLNDLKTFVTNLNKEHLELIVENPFEIRGNNLIRYFIKQIIKGFETLYIGNYTHFDFKPENTLIFDNLVIKLTDFGFLRNPDKIKDNLNKVRIPGFTDGYIPPECFYNENHLISAEEAIKLDYFALGATIYFLKYGETMMVYPDYKNDNSKADYMIKLIEKAIDKIQSTKLNDKDFNELLINLIHYKPEDRLSFEDIYRNKWLNKNWNKILEIKENNISDEQNLIIELDKSEFLFEKNNHINEQRKKIGIINTNENKSKKIYYHKFKLKL